MVSWAFVARLATKDRVGTWHHTLTLRAETTKGGKAAVTALVPQTVQAISRRGAAATATLGSPLAADPGLAWDPKVVCSFLGE